MVLDAVGTALNFVDVFIYVYILVLVLYALTSWIKLPYSLTPVQRFLDDVCNPYLRLWRRVIPMAGPLDLSPIAAIFGLVVLREILNALLGRLN